MKRRLSGRLIALALASAPARNERGDFELMFGAEERFEVPEVLVFGG
jgi:hypothetical protein